MSATRLATRLGALAVLAFAPPAAAEVVFKLEQTVQRGTGDLPSLDVQGDYAVAAVRDAAGRLKLFGMEIDDKNKLQDRGQVAGVKTAAHDVAFTMFGDVVVAALEPDADPSRGALTLDLYRLEEGGPLLIARERAKPGAPDAGGMQDKKKAPAAPGKLVLPAQPSNPSAGGQSGGRGPGAAGAPKPGVYGSEVAVEAVGRYLPDGDLTRNFAVTAMVDEAGELRIDSWRIENGKLTHVDADLDAGIAKGVKLTVWSKGVVAAVIDSDQAARFIAYEIDNDGAILRRGTTTYTPKHNVDEVDIANFATPNGEDRYLAAIAHATLYDLALMDLVGDGEQHKLIAKADGYNLAVSISLADAAAPDGALDKAYVAAPVPRGSSLGFSLSQWRHGAGVLELARKTVFDKAELGDEPAVARIGLSRTFGEPPEGTDAFLTLTLTETKTLRVDLWSAFFRNPIEGSSDGLQAAKPKPAPHFAGLQFSPNSPTRELFGDPYPLDMPDPVIPGYFEGCSESDIAVVKRAWARAHHHAWRAVQVLEWLNVRDDRAAVWTFGYDPNIGSYANGFTNHVPRAWFGAFEGERFRQALRTYRKVWQERFLGSAFAIKCRMKDKGGAHPCYTMDVTANHIVLGTINFCSGYFDANAWIEDQARIIVHEIFHWTTVPEGHGEWITDRHDYWDKCGIGGYHAVQPMYRDKAAYIGANRGCGERNYERAVRNNDNYAFFARELGRRVYDGSVKEFPDQSYW
jgi:hypothetical protein